jgi:hypothetical protein
MVKKDVLHVPVAEPAVVLGKASELFGRYPV